MKRIIGLLLLLGLLCGAAYLAINWNNQKNNSTINSYDRDFKVEDENQIHKIFISEKNNPDVTLERRGADWFINDKHKVHPNVIMRLLKVMTEMRIKYIPHPNAIPNIIKEMGLIGVKVEIYDESDSKLKTYYIGGATADERGTYMLMEGSDQPYVVDVVSYEGSVRGRFLNAPLQWRDKTFLEEKGENIKAIKVEYPKFKSDSFILDVEEGTVEPISSAMTRGKIKAKKGSITAYLKEMELIGAESIKNDYIKKDSITALLPFVNLTITHKDDTEQLYRFFPLKDIRTNKNTKSLKEVQGVERYFVHCVDGDFMLVQHLLVKGLLRSYDFFVEG